MGAYSPDVPNNVIIYIRCEGLAGIEAAMRLRNDDPETNTLAGIIMGIPQPDGNKCYHYNARRIGPELTMLASAARTWECTNSPIPDSITELVTKLVATGLPLVAMWRLVDYGETHRHGRNVKDAPLTGVHKFLLEKHVELSGKLRRSRKLLRRTRKQAPRAQDQHILVDEP